MELLTRVGIPAPASRMRDYPFQFSGGMLQRALIAIALASSPRLLLADEPTTSLDLIIQDQILSLLLELQRDTGMSMILVSHDLAVITEVCDRVIVMYGGQVVEEGDTATIITAPSHPYTRALLEGVPQAEQRGPLHSIPGSPPSLIDVPAGCRFVPAVRWRCTSAPAGPPNWSRRAARGTGPGAGATTRSRGRGHGRQPIPRRPGRDARMSQGEVRWGIVGTANIARAAFLPAVTAVGGIPAAVAGRDPERTRGYAAEHGIGRAITGYQALIDDDAIDALYIALPNSLHAQWTIAALRAGKPVLCEKPLCGRLPDTERVLEVARGTGTLLWEAFVFPFGDQMGRLRALVSDGAIGELREIQSDFHFLVGRPENIRLSAGLQGGALRDVGCYPVRLAQEFFGEHESAWAAATTAEAAVDLETWGSLGYAGGRRLLLSCGLRRGYDTFSRLLGTTGQIHVTNPFHPGPGDEVRLLAPRGAGRDAWTVSSDEPSFTGAVRHIQAVLRGEQEPRLLATETSLTTARALHDLAAAAAG
ncbi:MAG: oligopeptide/dipeptide ABC transporter ATP-binding protein [Streptosporangiaceae bacterium]